MKHLQALNLDPGFCPESGHIFFDGLSANGAKARATNGNSPSGDPWTKASQKRLNSKEETVLKVE